MDAADQTVLGPPQPAASGSPAWAQVPMAAPTLLDSQPPFRAVTPAGGHPALPARTGSQAAPADATIVDGRTAPRRTAPPASDRRTAVAAQPVRRRGPQTIAADQMHRAVDATRAEVAKRRQAKQRSGLWVVAVLGLLVAGVFVYATRFQAELVDPFEVTRTSSGYAVKAGLHTSAPAIARHPGGETAVDGAAELTFEMPAAALQLGENPVELQVVGAGTTRTLILHVMVYYHRATPPSLPPKYGRPVHLGLEVQPGWTAALKTPGSVTLVDPTHLRLSVKPDAAIDATPAGSTVMLPIPFELRAPDGTTHAFTERLHLPPPQASRRTPAPR